MRPVPLALYVALIGSLASCAERSTPAAGGSHTIDPPANDGLSNVTLLTALPIKHGSHAAAHVHDGTHYWLATDPTRGLILANRGGEVLASLPGSFERFALQPDVSLGSASVTLIATADVDTGDVVLASVDWTAGPSLKALSRLEAPQAEVDALCWYPTAEGHLSLFMGDARGQIEQRYIVDAARRELIDRSVRVFPGAPEISACAVDAANRTLFIVEEKAGVWAYPAEAETAPERELIVAVAPVGPIESEIEGLALASDGSLLLSAPETGSLWHVQGEPGGTARELSTAPVKVPEAIGVAEVEGRLLVTLYDDETAQYWQGELAGIGEGSAASSPGEDYPLLTPVAETEAVRRYGDAADDPAIWINSRDPARSLVLGTDKKNGLMVYDLGGAKLQELPVGRVNNVDVRYGFELDGRKFDLAAASNRSSKSISLFAIEPDNGRVTQLGDIATNLDDPYGLCMGHFGGHHYVYINDSDGRFQQYRLTAADGSVTGEVVREFRLESQPEGCVVDDVDGVMYLGEEGHGVWRVGADLGAAAPTLMASVGNGLVADVEGMAIYPLAEKKYLVVSSQGDNSYSIFDLAGEGRYLSSFRIGANADLSIDGASETDGLDITATALGEAFPDGLLVVQDGHNVLPQAPQNFKLVSGTEVRQFIEAQLNAKP